MSALLIIKKTGIISLKYALISMLLSIGLLVLKNNIYINYNNWDVYAFAVAVLFTGFGIWLATGFSFKQKAPIQQATPLTAILSKREIEVVELLCQNNTNQQIADKLCIELSTLKTHINHIYKKMGVKNRNQLAAIISANTRL